MDYNRFKEWNEQRQEEESQGEPENWVGNLMLECDVTVTEPKGMLVLELSRGIYRFQARIQLDSGKCTLVQRGPAGEKELETQDTTVKAAGTYQIRFANFDSRLTLWVDGRLPFKDGHAYTPPELPLPEEADLAWAEFKAALAKRCGPTANDLQPASIGSRGAAVEVNHLRLWRDTYYTISKPGAQEVTEGVHWSQPHTWDGIKHKEYLTMYVQPGHYLVLGDNSPASADSRSWGLVPERLLLGRALMVYWPPGRFGFIR